MVQLSPSQEIAAGFFAGVCDAVTTHPLDQVKTQFHVNTGSNGSVFASLRQQAAAGGLPQLYRGLTAACLRPQALCMYTGNEWCKRLVAGPSGELSVPGAFLASGCFLVFRMFFGAFWVWACPCPGGGVNE